MAHIRGFWNTVKRIGKEEGLRGYWRGTGPTIWRVVPGSAMYFLLLEKITNLLRRSDGIADIRTPLPVHLSLLAGASARSAASVLFLPITVVKTRFEAMGISNPYSSTIGAMQTIARVEGVSSLYRGLVPTVLRDAPHSAFYYAMYNYTKEVLSPYRRPDSQIPVAVLNFVAGLISGLTATIISHPFDVIRTRLQTQFATRSPQGMMAIAAYMIQVCLQKIVETYVYLPCPPGCTFASSCCEFRINHLLFDILRSGSV